MEFNSIGNIQNNNDCQILKAQNIWNKDVYSLDQTQLLASFQIAKIRHGSPKARQAFQCASSEALSDFVLGRIDNCNLMTFSPPNRVIEESEILCILESYDIYSKRAIMYSLFSGVHLRDVVDLTYSNLKAQQRAIKEDAPFLEGVNYIIESQPRHLHSNYVFWRLNSANMPQALLTLESEFISDNKMSWSDFSQQVKLSDSSKFI